MWRTLAVLATVCALGLTGVDSSQASSAGPSAQHRQDNSTAQQARRIRVAMDRSPTLHRSVTTTGGARIYRYDSSAGISFSTAVPLSGADPDLSAGGCGFLQSCIYLNHTDQKAVLYGGGAGVGAVICIVGTPAACVVAAVVIAVALVYLDDHGICGSNKRLRVRWFPTVGGAKCVS